MISPRASSRFLIVSGSIGASVLRADGSPVLELSKSGLELACIIN